jgi:uncharacterized membrane protein YqjE
MFELLNNVIVTVKKVPSLSHVPDQAIMAGFAVLVIALLLFIALMLFASVDFVATEKKEHHAPDAHKLILDLQKTLIQEMKGTAKQNQLMINLTIIFIVITILGMLVTVAGPATTMDFIKNLMSGVISWIKDLRPATTR